MENLRSVSTNVENKQTLQELGRPKAINIGQND